MISSNSPNLSPEVLLKRCWDPSPRSSRARSSRDLCTLSCAFPQKHSVGPGCQSRSRCWTSHSSSLDSAFLKLVMTYEILPNMPRCRHTCLTRVPNLSSHTESANLLQPSNTVTVCDPLGPNLWPLIFSLVSCLAVISWWASSGKISNNMESLTSSFLHALSECFPITSEPHPRPRYLNVRRLAFGNFAFGLIA